MPTPRKNQTIEELTEVFKSAHGVFLTDYSGLTVEMMTTLRKRCHAESVGFRVVKNTLARRAAKAAGLPDLGEWLTGTTALAYSEDPAQAIKLLRAFVREVREANGKPEVKKGLVDGHLLSQADLEALAKLSSPEIVRAKFLGLLQTPASQFVRLLSAGPASLVRALDQRRQQLENQSAPAEAGSTEAPPDSSAG